MMSSGLSFFPHESTLPFPYRLQLQALYVTKMATAYATPGASKIEDSAQESTCLFPRHLNKSLMISHWLLRDHMSHPEPIPVFRAVRPGLASSGHMSPLDPWWSQLFRNHVD